MAIDLAEVTGAKAAKATKRIQTMKTKKRACKSLFMRDFKRVCPIIRHL